MSAFGGKADTEFPQAIAPAVLRSNTLVYLENVGSQFLSLRQLFRD